MSSRASSLKNLEPGNDYLLTPKGDVYDAIKWITLIAKESADDEQIKKIAEELAKEDDPVRAVFQYAYDNVAYEPEAQPSGRDEVQSLRFSQRSLADNAGNCTAYTILISSLLQNLGVPHYLRVAGYEQPRQYQHIYVVTHSGKVLDPVVGQAQDGTATLYNRDGGHYNAEAKYITKKDFNMKIQALRGTRSVTSVVVPLKGDCGCGGCDDGCNGLGYIKRGRRMGGILGTTQELKDAKSKELLSMQTQLAKALADQNAYQQYLNSNCGRSVSGCNQYERDALSNYLNVTTILAQRVATLNQDISNLDAQIKKEATYSVQQQIDLQNAEATAKAKLTDATASAQAKLDSAATQAAAEAQSLLIKAQTWATNNKALVIGGAVVGAFIIYKKYGKKLFA